MRRGVSLLVTAVVTTGCGVGTDDAPRALDPGSAPFRDAFTRASPAPTGAGRVLVYLVRDGVLVAVPRRVPAPPTAQAVLQAVLSGPTARERDAGLTSSAPLEAEVTAAGLAGVVEVDIPAGDTATAVRSDEIVGYGQLVLSLTSLRGVTGVRFVRDGSALSVPRGDGQLTTTVLTRQDYRSLL